MNRFADEDRHIYSRSEEAAMDRADYLRDRDLDDRAMRECEERLAAERKHAKETQEKLRQ
jgi:hypothetical protein